MLENYYFLYQGLSQFKGESVLEQYAMQAFKQFEANMKAYISWLWTSSFSLLTVRYVTLVVVVVVVVCQVLIVLVATLGHTRGAS